MFELISLTTYCISCDVTIAHAHIAMLMLKWYIEQPCYTGSFYVPLAVEIAVIALSPHLFKWEPGLVSLKLLPWGSTKTASEWWDLPIRTLIQYSVCLWEWFRSWYRSYLLVMEDHNCSRFSIWKDRRRLKFKLTKRSCSSPLSGHFPTLPDA